jgi:hypothetical protein
MSKGESSEHIRIQNGLMNYLRKEGFEIFSASDREGYPQCNEINGCVPDMMGKNTQGLVAIGEAKTCDDLDNEKTNSQFTTFSSCLVNVGNAQGKLCPFYIGIPKSGISTLRQNLAKIGLDNKTNIQIIYFEI